MSTVVLFRLNTVRNVKCEKNEMAGHVASMGGKEVHNGCDAKI